MQPGKQPAPPLRDDPEAYPLGRPINRPEETPAPDDVEVKKGIFQGPDGKWRTDIPVRKLI